MPLYVGKPWPELYLTGMLFCFMMLHFEGLTRLRSSADMIVEGTAAARAPVLCVDCTAVPCINSNACHCI